MRFRIHKIFDNRTTDITRVREMLRAGGHFWNFVVGCLGSLIAAVIFPCEIFFYIIPVILFLVFASPIVVLIGEVVTL